MTKNNDDARQPDTNPIDIEKLYEHYVARIVKELETSRARISRFFLFNGILLSGIALFGDLDKNDPLIWLLLLL